MNSHHPLFPDLHHPHCLFSAFDCSRVYIRHKEDPLELHHRRRLHRRLPPTAAFPLPPFSPCGTTRDPPRSFSSVETHQTVQISPSTYLCFPIQSSSRSPLPISTRDAWSHATAIEFFPKLSVFFSPSPDLQPPPSQHHCSSISTSLRSRRHCLPQHRPPDSPQHPWPPPLAIPSPPPMADHSPAAGHLSRCAAGQPLLTIFTGPILHGCCLPAPRSTRCPTLPPDPPSSSFAAPSGLPISTAPSRSLDRGTSAEVFPILAPPSQPPSNPRSDRISDLPDDVLSYIVSLLPVKDSTRTSTLSTR